MSDYNNGTLPDPCFRLDYGFGEEWASVELGDGTGYVRLADCEKAVAESERLRDELDFERSENGWAREFLNRMAVHCGTKDCPSLVAYVEQLEAENAKLRELVLCLLTCASDSGDACDRCPANGGAGIWEFEDFCDGLLDRVHELGIEVGA